ncbi:hypothetical protein FXF51_00950 [Nonomuraea sp. PA05]|uniref:hypothetical protein n=1 Tax=Nonomuraea sp. PA05 TaxID=2604466 RepID=UPI0011D9C91B|nr:hypothetical protein [Nonomuraea sp. PA05]TYB71040.1 hypothetical protein FXF51_00950 [Nonomuraea sp. PA05]
MSNSPAELQDPPTEADDRARSAPQGAGSLTCPTCQGVVVGVDAGAYTVLRGQLILSNGYCKGDRCGTAG